MNETKAQSRSVTMPEALWNTVDCHAADDPESGDRSSYIRRLVTRDLQAAGKLPGSPEADAMQAAREMMHEIGPERFQARLREMAAAA